MSYDYKSWTYVPDNCDNEIGAVYTWNDVLKIAKGNEKLAKIIIGLCDWQYPETVLDELEREEEVVEYNGEYIILYDDDTLEQLWEEFGDVLIDYPNEFSDGVLSDDWFIFDAGTDKMDIWHWFDERHSNGVHKLMFPND